LVSGEYFRRQASVCLELAQVSEEAVAARLVQMAEAFYHKAREIDDAPSIVPHGWASHPSRRT
jgi:hypothetical protein